MLAISAKIELAPKDSAAYVAAAQKIITATHAEPGCLRYAIAVDVLAAARDHVADALARGDQTERGILGRVVADIPRAVALERVVIGRTHDAVGPGRRVLHAVGTGATELIHIGQCVMGLGGGLDYFLQTVFNYQTLAECYKVAALDAHNKLSL